MGVLRTTISLLGLGFNTYVYKLDTGNGHKKLRAGETDQFLEFRDRGIPYIILKTVPPRIDNKGNRHFYMVESDVHTFDIETGKVLDERLEKEFKEKLVKKDLARLKGIIETAQAEVLQERTREIYDSLVIKKRVGTITEEGEEIEEVQEDIIEFNIEVPAIKIGQTLEKQIEALTPHDTINEVMSMILDGTILSSLLTPAKFKWPMVFGILLVGICVGWILIILFAVFAPDQWAALVGKPLPAKETIEPPIHYLLSLSRRLIN